MKWAICTQKTTTTMKFDSMQTSEAVVFDDLTPLLTEVMLENDPTNCIHGEWQGITVHMA